VNILVTGGAGFIGSHIADALIHNGHSVVVLDDLSMGKREYVNPKTQFVLLDIRSEKIKEIFLHHRFDVVIHQAAQMDVRKSVEDPLFDASTNILGTVNLLEGCRATGVKKFIFASTGGAIYGEQTCFPADEQHPTRPVSPYGITKLSAEKYLFYYQQAHGLQYVSLRYANVYGPRQNPHGEAGVVAIFTGKMLSDGQPLINGDGTQTRDYIYVDDIVKANLLALNYKQSAIFNVGTGIETNVNQLFLTLRKLTGSQCREKYGPAKNGEQQRSVIDSSSLYKAFNWKPSIALRDGLRRTVDSMRV
jgi:UDP-glucose 4-epimerase